MADYENKIHYDYIELSGATMGYINKADVSSNCGTISAVKRAEVQLQFIDAKGEIISSTSWTDRFNNNSFSGELTGFYLGDVEEIWMYFLFYDND